jgi:hypothetical protein
LDIDFILTIISFLEDKCLIKHKVKMKIGYQLINLEEIHGLVGRN